LGISPDSRRASRVVAFLRWKANSFDKSGSFYFRERAEEIILPDVHWPIKKIPESFVEQFRFFVKDYSMVFQFSVTVLLCAALLWFSQIAGSATTTFH
jgi:hypothetical protein